MINGRLFAKFQKLLPKMNKGLKAKNCTPNAFFMADANGCAATDGFSLLYAPVEDACEQPVALTELPKVKFGDAVFIEAVGKHINRNCVVTCCKEPFRNLFVKLFFCAYRNTCYNNSECRKDTDCPANGSSTENEQTARNSECRTNSGFDVVL